MRLYASIGLAALLVGMPATGQEIIQRMERDVVPGRQTEPALETARLLGAEALQEIALADGFSRELRSEERGILRRVVLRLRQGSYALARKEWELTLGKLKEREIKPDLDALVATLLNHAYFQGSGEIVELAQTVKFREEQQRAVSGGLANLERMKTLFDEGTASDDLVIRPIKLAAQYGPRARASELAEAQPATAETVAAEVKRTEELRKTADDNFQQSVSDLQKAMQDQKMTLQTMSNVAKMLHDTAKVIINDTKG